MAVEVEGATGIDPQRAGLEERIVDAEPNRAAVDGEAAAEGADAAERQPAGASLVHFAAVTGDRAGESGVAAVAHGELADTERNGAAVARQRADGLVVVVEIEGAAGVHRHRAGGRERAVDTKLKRAAV